MSSSGAPSISDLAPARLVPRSTHLPCSGAFTRQRPSRWRSLRRLTETMTTFEIARDNFQRKLRRRSPVQTRHLTDEADASLDVIVRQYIDDELGG